MSRVGARVPSDVLKFKTGGGEIGQSKGRTCESDTGH